VADGATDSPYSPSELVPDMEQQREAILAEPGSSDSQFSAFDETLQAAREQFASQLSSLDDFVAVYTPDAVSADDQINSRFPTRAMVRGYILKLLSPDIGDYALLEFRLDTNPEWAERMGFDRGQTPDRTTFSKHWWKRYQEPMRTHIRFEAARAAKQALAYGFEISDEAHDLIDRYTPGEPEDKDIPEERYIEESERDRVFNEYRDLFNDILSYGRGPNKQIPASDLTEQATFNSRRNESMRGGRDVYTKEHAVADSEYMTPETLASPIRDYSRRLAELNYARHHAIPPNERAFDWSVNPENRDYGEGERWHDRTERGIGKQVEMLQDRGMLDRPVDICIDGTAREYNNRNDTDVEEPDGVLHRYPKYETGYAWEDITVTAIYRGRAIVLASVSKVKDDSQFQCVRYLLDRARDLVSVRNVYADSEFGTRRICSYITQEGMDYVIKKRKTSTVKDFFSEADGRADWTNYEIKGGSHKTHKTTLVALESTSKAVTKKGEKRKAKEENDDGRKQATLPGTTSDDDDDEDDDSDDIKLEAWVTSLDVVERGLEPECAGPRRKDHTAFGVGQLYRKRWSIETAFRDIKQNFKAKPRSRCLGVRRFFFMLCLLLYNCWVLLNLIVADEANHRDDDEIIWRKKIFIIDLHNEVFADREFG